MKAAIKTTALLMFIVVSSSTLIADQSSDLRVRVRDATAGFKDMRAAVVVAKSDRKELQKIGKSFAETYEINKADVAFQMPASLKMSGELGMVNVEFISADDTRTLRIPSIGYKKTKDISDSPVLRTSSLDVGIVTDAVWDIYSVGFVRTEQAENGDTVYVLRIQPGHTQRSFIIWVDGSSFKLLRLDRLLSNGELKVKTLYKDHKKIDEVWVPTRAEVYNGEGKLAAVTETRDVRVNVGIDVKEFK